MESKINVVLVHGAWADASSSWGKVIPLLDQKRFNVTAVQLPLTSLEDDIAVTAGDPENLSAMLPSRADDVERWIAEA